MAKQKAVETEAPADPFERLIKAFEGLPGVGRRSAERMAYHLLKVPNEQAMRLAIAIRDTKKILKPCADCGDLTDQQRCTICQNPNRNDAQICVVEWPKDLKAIEKSGAFQGRYHVLMGRLSPLSGIEPKDLRIEILLRRLESTAVQEVVFATSPTAEGDATAQYIKAQMAKRKPEIKTTRLARGLPAGSELSFAQSGTIDEALKGRSVLK